MRRDTPAEVQHQTTRMGDKRGGSVQDFLKDGTNAAAFGQVPDRDELTDQAELTDEAQAVVSKGRQQLGPTC